MKAILTLICLALIGLSFSGCKKDKNAAVTGPIVGEWHVTEIKYSTVMNGTEQVTSDKKYDATDITTHFAFYDNGTGLQHPADPAYANLSSFNYTLANSVLTVKPMFFLVNHEAFTVTKLADTEMVLTVKIDNTNGSYDLTEISLRK